MYSLCGADNFRCPICDCWVHCTERMSLCLSALDWPAWACECCGMPSVNLWAGAFQGVRLCSLRVVERQCVHRCSYWKFNWNSEVSQQNTDQCYSLDLSVVLILWLISVFSKSWYEGKVPSVKFFHVTFPSFCVLQMCLWTGSRMSMKLLWDCAVERVCRG